jgi:hypothetical protein
LIAAEGIISVFAADRGVIAVIAVCSAVVAVEFARSDVVDHASALRVKPAGRIGVADVRNGLAHDCDMIKRRGSRHLAFHDYESVFGGGFDGDAGIRVHRKICVEDRIGDDVAYLVGMPLGYGFRSEKSGHGIAFLDVFVTEEYA